MKLMAPNKNISCVAVAGWKGKVENRVVDVPTQEIARLLIEHHGFVTENNYLDETVKKAVRGGK